MKRVKSGISYNTETSTLIARAKWTDDDDEVWTGGIYQTRKGDLFVYQEYDPKLIGGTVLYPVDQAQADEWIKLKDAEVLIRDTDAAWSGAYFRLPATLKTGIEAEALKDGLSLNAWAIQCFERFSEASIGTGPKLAESLLADIEAMGSKLATAIARKLTTERRDDRLRVPLEHDYAFALGRAIFIFAKLEWSAVNCCERIESNSYHSLPFRQKTAERLARRLIDLAATLPPSTVQDELREAAAEFNRLRKTRNGLLHVQPGSTTDGAQRLFRDGVAWEVEDFDEAADDFTKCNDRFVALWHELPRGGTAAS